MSVVERIKSVLPLEEDADTTTYQCQDCGNKFESSKTPEDARCTGCISDNVERA